MFPRALFPSGLFSPWLFPRFGLAPNVEDPTEVQLGINTDERVMLLWVELTTSDGSLHAWAKVAIPDPESFYGGFKGARVLKFGRIVRALSDASGQIEGTDFSVSLSDSDRAIRSMLDNESTRYFVNRPIVIRMIDDKTRRTVLATPQPVIPRTVIRGLVNRYQPGSGLTFDLFGVDAMSRSIAGGRRGYNIPRRVITKRDFPVCPDENLGLPVPIIYGIVTDRNVVVIEPGTVVLAHNAALAVPQGASANDIAPGGNLPDGQLWAYVTAVHGPAESPVSNLAGTNYVDRKMRVNWNRPSNGETGITKYRVYVFNGPGTFYPSHPAVATTCTFCRYVEHDVTVKNGLTGYDYTEIVDIGSGVNYLTGEGFTTTTEYPGKGVIRPIYVGDEAFDDVVWSGALICGHAIHHIDAAFITAPPEEPDPRPAGYVQPPDITTPVDLDTDPDWLTPRNAALWASVGWTTPYRDLGYPIPPGEEDPIGSGANRRYTMIWVKGKAAEHLRAGQIALNIWGIENVGDGTGLCYTDMFHQYLHCLQNWVLNNYESGPWVPTPIYEDGDSTPILDDASFYAASEVAKDRFTGGYEGAAIIGLDGQITARELIARFNVSADCDAGLNRHGQFFVSMLGNADVTVPTPGVSPSLITDLTDVNLDSFQVSDDVDSHWNELPYRAAPRYAGNGDSWLIVARMQDRESQTNYGEVITGGEVLLHYVRSSTQASEVMRRRITLSTHPPRTVTFSTGLQGLNYELGNSVRLTHYAGIGSIGYVGQPLRLRRVELDPDAMTVHMTALDLNPLIKREPSPSPSSSPSRSVSLSPSSSTSRSPSPSASMSPSVSRSASPSASVSRSASRSASPSASVSASASRSASPSGSASPSSSTSRSVSPSASRSPSASASRSASASPSPSIAGTIAWSSGAHNYNNSVNTSVTPHTWSFDNQGNLLFVAVWGPNPAMTVTYGGVSVPQLQFQDFDGSFGVGLYALLDPPTGVNNFSFSGGASFQSSLVASLSGVGSIQGSVKGFQAAGVLSLSMTPTVNNAWMLASISSSSGWDDWVIGTTRVDDLIDNTSELASLGPISAVLTTMTGGDVVADNAGVLLTVRPMGGSPSVSPSVSPSASVSRSPSASPSPSNAAISSVADLVLAWEAAVADTLAYVAGSHNENTTVNTSVTPHTWAYNNQGNVLVLGVWGPNPSMTVTYGGVAMTRAQYQDHDGFFGVAVYTLMNPPTGVNNFSYSAGSSYQSSSAASLSGAGSIQGSVKGSNFGQVSLAMTPTIPNGWLVAYVASGSGWSGWTVGTVRVEDPINNTTELATHGPISVNTAIVGGNTGAVSSGAAVMILPIP